MAKKEMPINDVEFRETYIKLAKILKQLEIKDVE